MNINRALTGQNKGSMREKGVQAEIKTLAVGNKSPAATEPVLSVSYAAQSETTLDWYAGNAS